MMIKYPVHKLAKDFSKQGKALPSKEIMDILTQYGHPPKNHMQPLNDLELSIVFEYLTQHNQIDSIEQVYADVYHEPESKKEPAPKAEGRQAQPKGVAQEGGRPAQAGGQNHKRRYRPHHRRRPGSGQEGQG